jgi:hypothetical protein
MATFQERIKQTLARVDSRRATGSAPAAQLDGVLREFVRTLMDAEPYVGAAIEIGHLPQMRSFVTWPRYRRDERSIMLTFWWDGTAMRVVNDVNREPFRSPEALSDYLVNFLENSAFPETLVSYERRCKEDVDGFLRVTSLIDTDPDEVMVAVRAADQKKLAEAQPGAVLNLTVHPEPVAGTAQYSERGTYKYLNSGGFGLRRIMHHLSDGKIHLNGEVMGLGETT